jgi:NADH:quinone reductase (non-electrogenic)
VSGAVPVFETACNVPRELIDLFKASGAKVIHKCTQVRHAVAAERNGVDIVSVDGFECAGHPGEKDVPNFLLVPLILDALNIPAIVSGGNGDGRGLAAALAMGAAGVNMGTRFVATKRPPFTPALLNRTTAS